MLMMIPIPVPIYLEHFLSIYVRDSVLCLDKTKQYHFTMTDDELSECNMAEPGRYACTHQLTLLSTVTTESCAVILLHKRDSLPPVCDTVLIRLSNTVWTQFSNNIWIFMPNILVSLSSYVTTIAPYTFILKDEVDYRYIQVVRDIALARLCMEVPLLPLLASR